MWFNPWVGKITWRREWLPNPVFQAGEFQPRMDYRPWSRKESETTERLSLTQFSSVQSVSCIRLFVNPQTAARQASLSITNSRSLLKLMSIKSVMPSNFLILCCPLLLPPSIFPRIRVFSNESVLHIRWSKYWSFSFNISPSNEYSGLISFRWTGWISLQSKELSRVFSNTTVQKHQFFSAQLSLQSNSHWKNHSFDQMDFCWQSNVSAF